MQRVPWASNGPNHLGLCALQVVVVRSNLDKYERTRRRQEQQDQVAQALRQAGTMKMMQNAGLASGRTHDANRPTYRCALAQSLPTSREHTRCPFNQCGCAASGAATRYAGPRIARRPRSGRQRLRAG